MLLEQRLISFLKMKFTFLLLLTFLIESHACFGCPSYKPKDSIRDCEKCFECRYYGRKTSQNMNSWCRDPVCGEAYYGGKFWPS